MLLTRHGLAAALLVLGVAALAHAARRRSGSRYRSNEPIPGWVYACFGYRITLVNPTVGHLEREGALAEAIASTAALALGIALFLVQS